MKTSLPYKKIIVEVVCYLTILLFVYAAVSKLTDLQNFQVQVGQSPMLSAFAGILAICVPIIELIITILIAFPRTRLAGLYAAFCLMVMFSVYIFIILNFGSHVPCSCGGILEKLGWKEHLAFNLIFVIILVIALILELPKSVARKRFGMYLAGSFLVSAFAIGILYFLSEDIIHHRNNFLRRYPAFSDLESRKYDLKSPAFYFAGAQGNTIYLGNTLAPRVVIAIDTNFRKVREIVIDIDRMDLPFRSVQVRVDTPFFYMTDGSVPCVFRGRINEWKAHLVNATPMGFTHAEPIDSNRFAVKVIDPKLMKTSLGIMDVERKDGMIWKRELLLSDGDGIFDVDGQLIRNGLNKKFHYIHFYRNEYFTIDHSLNLVKRGHTIDTVSKSDLKVAYLKQRGERKLSAPALTVNKTGAAYGNLLFINSQMIGKYEDEQMWKHASIIDIYDINDNSYRTSFYLYHIKNNPMRSFIVRGQTLYAISGKWLSAVPLPRDVRVKI
jgi:uncharacterized membrane protein YphA (DoxX/SURF4 family)